MFLILLLVSCVLRITPFGDSTFLYDDMKRQYVDFYSYYRQIFYSSNDFPFLHCTGKIVSLLLTAAEMIFWFVFTDLHSGVRTIPVLVSESLFFGSAFHGPPASCSAFAVPRPDAQYSLCYTYGIPADDRGITEFHNTADAEAELVNAVKCSDSGFCRMENLALREQNDSMPFVYIGVTHYNSKDSLDVRRFLRRLGFDYKGRYSSYGSSNTRTADSIPGVKYILSRDKVRKMNRYMTLPPVIRLFRQKRRYCSSPLRSLRKRRKRIRQTVASGEPSSFRGRGCSASGSFSAAETGRKVGTIEKISSSHLRISLLSDSQSVLLAIP